ncbi:MAG: hypothetical protein ACXWV2_00430 [Chitinophagaceae bacterium]
MKQEKDIERRVEETLNSLDGIQRAEPGPWLFSRVKGRLAQEEKTAWGAVGSFLSRPAIAIAALCLILMLNGFLLLNQEKEPSATILTSQNEQPVDSESLIASSSSFDYETFVQP